MNSPVLADILPVILEGQRNGTLYLNWVAVKVLQSSAYD